MGRFAARLLLSALKSTAVQTVAAEIATHAARQASAFLLRKLRAGSKALNDDSAGRRHSNPAF